MAPVKCRDPNTFWLEQQRSLLPQVAIGFAG
jgi:hypothetical protein